MNLNLKILSLAFLLFVLPFGNNLKAQISSNDLSEQRPVFGLQIGYAGMTNIDGAVDHTIGTNANMELLFPFVTFNNIDLMAGLNLFVEQHVVDGVFQLSNPDLSRAEFVQSPDNYKNNNFNLIYAGIPIDIRFRFNDQHNSFMTFGYRLGYNVWNQHSFKVGQERFEESIENINHFRSDLRLSFGRFLNPCNDSSPILSSFTVGGFYQLDGLASDGEVNNYGFFLGFNF